LGSNSEKQYESHYEVIDEYIRNFLDCLFIIDFLVRDDVGFVEMMTVPIEMKETHHSNLRHIVTGAILHNRHLHRNHLVQYFRELEISVHYTIVA
jgi:hypothetical protein